MRKRQRTNAPDRPRGPTARPTRQSAQKRERSQVRGRSLSRKRAEYYLSKYPFSEAQRRFTSFTPWSACVGIDDEIRKARLVRDALVAATVAPKPVFAALRTMGTRALWIVDAWETDPESLEDERFQALHDICEEIRTSVRARISEWETTGRTARKRADRQVAAGRLGKLGNVLAPDLRGLRGEIIVDPYTVRREYAQQLIRLYAALRALQSSDIRPARRSHIESIMLTYGVERSLIKKCMDYDDPALVVLLLRRSQMEFVVREWLGQRNDIGEATVANILSAVRPDR